MITLETLTDLRASSISRGAADTSAEAEAGAGEGAEGLVLLL